MKNSKDYRIVWINGEERFFYLRNIGVWRPNTSSSDFADATSKKSRRLRPIPVSYPCPFCTEPVASEKDFEKIPTKEKILRNPEIRGWGKNNILRSNDRRKEKRIINTPNRRLFSHLTATQIRAAI